jgi:hypothetical protein
MLICFLPKNLAYFSRPGVFEKARVKGRVDRFRNQFAKKYGNILNVIWLIKKVA